jgi:hypothetical protein
MSDKKLPKTVTLGGRRYRLYVFGPIDGLCDAPKVKEREIFILAEPFTCAELITIIHESLHAEDWSVSDGVVDRVSAEIGKLLWRFGYRRKRK